MRPSDALPRRSLVARLPEGVRLRNALRLQPSAPADFDWTPDRVPADFMVERGRAPKRFARIVAQLDIAHLPDWERARALAGHLVERAQDEGPIRADLLTTYRRIRSGYGHCTDFARVYLALAHAAGLFARQWAFTHNGFGGNGHVVVEVYDRQRAKWVFLDVYNNFFAVDEASGELLSALEFRDSILGLRSSALIHRIGAGRKGFVYHGKLLAYYQRGAAEWHLIWGNAVCSVERNPLVRWGLRVHPALGQGAAWLCHRLPGIRILETPDNRAAVDALERLSRRLRIAGVVLAAAALCVVIALALSLAGVWP